MNSSHLRQLHSSPNPLLRPFFDRATLQVAKDLLGKYLLRETPAGLIQSRIVDVEAYIGPKDKACHASRGRTKRTDIMFGPSGVTYVYFIYGMYYCLNLVTERVDFPAAVLIRGIEVFENAMGRPDSPTRIDGPGRVCRFLQIDKHLNGVDTTQGKGIWVEDRGEHLSPKEIQKLPRVGVNYAGEWSQKLWRFCLPAAPVAFKGKRPRASSKSGSLRSRP